MTLEAPNLSFVLCQGLDHDNNKNQILTYLKVKTLKGHKHKI